MKRILNTISTEDSKYQIYLTVVIRNAQGELIGITEATRGIHIAHEITDYVFNEKLGEKEVIMIDNIKYEKVQFVVSHDFLEHPSSFLVHVVFSYMWRNWWTFGCVSAYFSG